MLLPLTFPYLFDHFSAILDHNGLGVLDRGRGLVVIAEQPHHGVLVPVPVGADGADVSAPTGPAGRAQGT